MENIKKTIFMSDKLNINHKEFATITLEKQNNNVLGTLKSYSLDNNHKYVLGLKLNNKILKQNILLDNNKYNFILTNQTVSPSISCVIMKFTDNKYSPLIWGSTDTVINKNEIVYHLNQSIEKIKNNDFTNTQSTNNKSNDTTCVQDISQPNPTKSKLEKLTQNVTTATDTNEVCMATNKAELFESNEEEINQLLEKELNKTTAHPFYNMISNQIDELFERYPHEEKLEALISNSKWVKIPNDDNKYYVVGIISQDNDIKYICYGVPGTYNIEPPIEMREYSQWFPNDIINPYEKGYWVMYQDANSGENVTIKF